MAFNTTAVVATSTPVAVISTATTWAHIRNCSLTDPVPLVLSNQSTAGLAVYLTGDSAATSAKLGLPLGVGDPISFNLVDRSPLFAYTTASTAAVHLLAGRQ